ncbi:MAG: isocitrate lyase/phosphoenolpyruvate mutase family protein [Pseudomonadota bacterium]
MTTRVTQAELCRRFAKLHEADGAFIIPNPWDAGTARLLQGMGFAALATTSGGFALTLAKADGPPSLEEKLAHCRALVEAVDIPVSADFEDGYADTSEGVADNTTRLIATGVAGCSIEDYSRTRHSLFEKSEAVDRLAAAAEVVAALDFPFVLTGRAENLIRGVDDLNDTIERLVAYEAAGARVLYAPGLRTLDQVRAVTEAVTAPVNVLGVLIPGATQKLLADAGAARISIGGALTYAAMKPVLAFGDHMITDGDFSWAEAMASGTRIAELMDG